MHQPAQDYLAARRALGNSNTEAIRALKRHPARRVFPLLRSTEPVTLVSDWRSVALLAV